MDLTHLLLCCIGNLPLPSMPLGFPSLKKKNLNLLQTGAEVEVPAKDVSGLSVTRPPLPPTPCHPHGQQTSPRTVFYFVFFV